MEDELEKEEKEFLDWIEKKPKSFAEHKLVMDEIDRLLSQVPKD